MEGSSKNLSPQEALATIRGLLTSALPARAREWWDETEAKVGTTGETKTATGEPGPATGGTGVLDVAFPALVRRCGREPLVEPEDARRFLQTSVITLDLAGYRRADAAAVILFTKAMARGETPALLRRLFDRGDMDERVSVMRCLPFAGDDPTVLGLLGEAQRSNTMDLYEGAWCDHDLASRRLPDDDFNRMILKLAFGDIPLWRVLGALNRANPELSRMLQDFATEREAAGRPIWVDTLRLIARAPVEGTRARLIGHLEHGKDALRLAAAESVPVLQEPETARFLAERLDREMQADVRRALKRGLEILSA